MNVLFSSDDNYAPLLGTCIYSLLKNNSDDFNKFNIFVLDGGISTLNKNKIISICNGFEGTFTHFIEFDNLEERLGINVKASRPLSAYARLFSASLLNEDIDKILYLDCDALVTGSFKELWELDITNHDCAAVLDAGPKYINMFLDLPINQEHFNSGLLLINLNGWRKNNLERLFLDYILSKGGNVFHNDQGVINVVCKDKIFKLNPEYNLLSPFFEVGYDKVLQWYNMDEYYSKDILNNALENPIFIHLTQFVNGRPWFNNATNHPLRKLFDSYAEKTPFKDEVYSEDNRHFKGKFFSVVYKFLPYSIICYMFRIYEFILIKRGTGSI